MPGSDDAPGGEVEAPVALVVAAVAEEHARHGPRIELVGRCRGLIRVAQAPKHPQVIVRWRDAEEEVEWSDISSCLTRTPVQKVGGRRQGLGPELWWNMSMKQHSTHAVVKGP
jgi:hypothetical protein